MQRIFPLQYPLNCAILTRPRGGEWLMDDIKYLKESGIDVVVSALTFPEEIELGLVEERSACQQLGLHFVSHPIMDRSIPESRRSFITFLNEVEDHLKSGRRIGVHCRMGVGRSTLILAGVMTKQGIAPNRAWEILEISRGREVPDTTDQKRWIDDFAGMLKDLQN